MQIIQKQLHKKEQELPKQISKNVDDKKFLKQKEKIENKKNYTTRPKRKNHHINNHRDFEISHEKITKHSSHNLKYERKVHFKNQFKFIKIFTSSRYFQ